jgi:NarL family two-component system response regulator LiaR
MAASISVVIADDHAVVRDGLRTYLQLEDEIELIGEGANGKEALRLAIELKPDVVIMDLQMPELDGIAATLAIREQAPGTRVIVLTSFVDDEYLLPAIRAGAIGYLLKDSPGEEIVRAIRDASRGQPRLHATVTRRLMEQVASPPPAAVESPPGPASNLTSREMEVLQLVARGMSNKEIARTLVTSDRTVKSHVSNLLAKLGVLDRTQAALFAVRAGLVPPDG